MKRSWPELVGLPKEEAERKIKEEIPGALVKVVPPGCGVTYDFRQDRVHLYVDSLGRVVHAPTIG